MKKSPIREEGVEGWEATGTVDNPEHRGRLRFYLKDGKPFSWVRANATLRTDGVKQGDRSNNPFLRKESCFPLLYALCRSVFWTREPYSHFDDLIQQIKNHPDFQEAIREERDRRLCGSDLLVGFSRGEGDPIDGPGSYPTRPLDLNNHYEVGLIAERKLKDILFRAAGEGPVAMDMIFKASRSIDLKLQYLSKERILFLEALGKVTKDLGEVPNQKQLREFFIQERLGRTEDQFKELRNSLGFRWLPQASRGVKARRRDKM